MIPLALLTFLQTPKYPDPKQVEERTMFQTRAPYEGRIDLRGDVAIVYDFGKDMPGRVRSWRAKGYRIHLMTGVSWGEYQDYLFGRWDGKSHLDEAQTRANGERIGHDKDVYYMCPGPDYGKYLAEGVLKACEAGVEAIHLEEPEFWASAGYEPAFKREWQAMYGEPWQAPDSSVDARWRSGKLKYYLYRRALQQVFDAVQGWNAAHGKRVRCYVPTHSLLNYADWSIVSPESSLARLKGCDGYIAQVWTNTAREPNVYQGVEKQRTFEYGLVEYGIMQNLVRSTGREVWYLADPSEDKDWRDWGDHRENYHATLVASLLQPDVWKYEIAPWPERIFGGTSPAPGDVGQEDRSKWVGIAPEYAQELQQVFNALKDTRQKDVEWLSGTRGVGLVMSDSLMFQRGGPSAGDDLFGHVMGLALPFIKRGVPLQPMQLENVGLKGYLDGLKVLLMSYEGQKPLDAAVHRSIADWTRRGGTLVFVDDDADPFNGVREWWNTGGKAYATPRQELFERLGVARNAKAGGYPVGKGRLLFLDRRPSLVSRDPEGARWLYDAVRKATPNVAWHDRGAIGLRRGPYVAIAGLDETDAPSPPLKGRYVDLFDPALRVQRDVPVEPNSRRFLIDLGRFRGTVVACAGQALGGTTKDGWRGTVEGIADTPGALLLRLPRAPRSATVDGQAIADMKYDPTERLLWLRFPNTAEPRRIEIGM